MIHNQLIDREQEIDSLLAGLDQCVAGRLAVRLVVGESGEGKTFLLREFTRRALDREENPVVVTGHCNAQSGKTNPYLPFGDLMAQLTGVADKEVASRAEWSDRLLGRLQSVFSVSTTILLDLAPDLINTLIPGSGLLARATELVTASTGIRRQLEGLAERKTLTRAGLDREQIFSQFTGMVAALSQRFPLVLVVEDLHWADDSSLGLFYHLLRNLGDSHVLLIGSYRGGEMEKRFEELGQSIDAIDNEIRLGFGDIWLNLSTQDRERRCVFVNRYVDAVPNTFDQTFRETLYQKTGGQPFFVAELLQHLKDTEQIRCRGDGVWLAPPELDLSMTPARLEGMIAERLLGLDEKLYDILSVASVEGDVFSLPVLIDVLHEDELRLLKHINRQLEKRYRLVREGPLNWVNGHWVACYAFESSFLQQFLYRRNSLRGRQILHDRVARTLERIHGDGAREIAPVLAHHHDRGGNRWEAASHYLEAGRRALEIGSYPEAARLLDRAMVLLRELPADDQVLRRRVDVQLLNAAAVKAAYGWGSPEAEAVQREARELCRETDAAEDLAPFLFDQWAFHLTRWERDEAERIARDNIRLGEDTGSAAIAFHGKVALGNTLFWLGRFEECAQCLEQARLLREQLDGRQLIARYGLDAGTIMYMFLSLASSLRGDLQRAGEYREIGLNSARELNHPFGIAIALQAAAWADFHALDIESALGVSRQLVEFTDRYKLGFYHPLGLMLRGWARALAGEPAAGIADIEAGWAEQRSTVGGEQLLHSLYSLLLATALRAANRQQEALAAVERGLDLAERAACLAYVAELLRQRGELKAGSDPLGAHEDLERALAIARDQGARTCERRVLASLLALSAAGPARDDWQRQLDLSSRSTPGEMDDGQRCASPPSITAEGTHHVEHHSGAEL